MAELKDALATALPRAELIYAGPTGSRGVVVIGEGGEVDINRENKSELVISTTGLNENFYKVRKAMYAKYRVV